MANPEEMKTTGGSGEHNPSLQAGGQSSTNAGKENATKHEVQQTSISGKPKAFDSVNSDRNGSKSVRIDRASSLTDSFDVLKSQHRTPSETEESGEEIEDRNSSELLSEDNLSVDARACAMPKHKSKTKHVRHDKTGDAEEAVFEHEQEKDINKPDKKAGGHNTDDIEDFIRGFVQKQVLNKHEVKFFDAAIVYDKNDYEDVISFRDELTDLVKSQIQDNLRIELFDSEEFVQSKIMVVQDVIDRCSVVLIYLSSNFTSPELHLFTEEAIGLSRFGYNDPEFSAGRFCSQRQWILKPVHTKPRKSRDYKTPIGLLTVNGIDWFDRHSEHTINQVISIMQMAVTQRKQRSLEINTNNAYKDAFGSVPVTPQLGPPFNRTFEPFSGPNVHSPIDQKTPPLISHPTDDAMSFSRPFVFPRLPSDPSVVRVDTQPSYLSDAKNMSRFADRSLHTMYSTPPYESLPKHATQPSFGPTQFSKEFYRGDGQHHSGFSEHQYNPISRPSSYVSSFQPQNLPGSQAGYIYQSAGLHRERNQASQKSQVLVHPNYQPMTMQQEQEVRYPPRIGVQRPQTPIYSPTVHAGAYNPFQGQYLSQDAPQSSTGSYTPDQRNEHQSPTQMSVVSKVTGKLIVKSNLSADDDVEIDTSYSDRQNAGPKSAKKQYRSNRMSYDSDEESAESDDSDSDDSDDDGPDGRRLVHKIVNIVGCKTVQLGKGNRVREMDAKPRVKSKDSKRNASPNHRVVREKTDRAEANESSQHFRNDLKTMHMNIVAAKDYPSVENDISKYNKSGFVDSYSAEKMNRLSSDEEEKMLEVCSEKMKDIDSYMVESKRTQSDNKQKPILHVSVNKPSDFETNTEHGRNIYSPDDNILEEQLFGTGFTESDEKVNSDTKFSSKEAPFSFSYNQLTQKTPNFRRMVHSDVRTFEHNKCVYNELD